MPFILINPGQREYGRLALRFPRRRVAFAVVVVVAS